MAIKETIGLSQFRDAFQTRKEAQDFVDKYNQENN